MDTATVTDLHSVFNVTGSGLLSREEFRVCWQDWIKPVARPSCALVVIKTLLLLYSLNKINIYGQELNISFYKLFFIKKVRVA